MDPRIHGDSVFIFVSMASWQGMGMRQTTHWLLNCMPKVIYITYFTFHCPKQAITLYLTLKGLKNYNLTMCAKGEEPWVNSPNTIHLS